MERCKSQSSMRTQIRDRKVDVSPVLVLVVVSGWRSLGLCEPCSAPCGCKLFHVTVSVVISTLQPLSLTPLRITVHIFSERLLANLPIEGVWPSMVFEDLPHLRSLNTLVVMRKVVAHP